MGKALAEAEPEAREVFSEADRVLDAPLTRLMFAGPEAELTLTHNAQPAILTVSVAAARILAKRGAPRPAFCAGHSLGEYSALVFAGAMSLPDALRAVRQRGRLMQEAVPQGRGAMAAVLGLERAAVDEVCADVARRVGLVAAANYNGAGQIVISGEAPAVREAGEALKARGAKRVLPLAVSAPFHCPLMQPAADRMRPVLDAIAVRRPEVPLVCNVTGRPYEAQDDAAFAAEARAKLTQQIVSPVLWEETMETMRHHAVSVFVEVGPGNVLSGLARRAVPGARCVATEAPPTFDKALEALRG
ncbi:MAG: ACP S-malonyltransferase [Nitrospirae bacterium]|nr:ACP S-malonyltransferase [Nitrospirota bacterium]